MARPTKEGLDYFPLDIDIDQDDKLVVPIAKYGMRGFGIIIKLMMEIYRNGYFYEWTERELFVFSKRINDDINFVTDVINECIKWGFFSQELFDEYCILTSAGFQKRYIEASKRRKSITFIDRYTLIDLSKACEKVAHPIIEVDEDGNQVNVYINPNLRSKTDAESTQSKKKVKEKEIKRNIKKKDINTFSAYTSNTELISTLESFVEFRKKIKKPMTDRAIELLLNKLDKLANDDGEKIAVLEQSILNGWQGLFPLKNKGGEKNAADRESVADPYASIDFGF